MSDAINNSSTGLIKRVTDLEQGGSIYEPDATYTNVGSMTLTIVTTYTTSYSGGTVYYSSLYESVIVKNLSITVKKVPTTYGTFASNWYFPSSLPTIYRPNQTYYSYYNTSGPDYFYISCGINGGSTYNNKYIQRGSAEISAGNTYTCSFKLDWHDIIE